jgi:hypothetical protein
VEQMGATAARRDDGQDATGFAIRNIVNAWQDNPTYMHSMINEARARSMVS